MSCNSSGTQIRRYEAFISNTRLRRHRDEDHGGRSGVREACEPAQRVLDDLVQGHPILLLQRGVPAQVRLQAGALPRAYARASSKPSRVVTVVRDLQVPHEVLTPVVAHKESKNRGSRVTQSSAGPPPVASATLGSRGSRSRGQRRGTQCRQGGAACPMG